MSASLQLASHCKVNLLLNTLGRRPDGFTELETILQPVGLTDELTFETAATGVALTCSEPALPVDASNLVHRAATAFLAAAGIRDGVRIHLEKRIPMAAGLGGGSGNAATTLTGLNRLMGQPLAPEALVPLAAALGSDVPFFLQPGPALATGRGEHVQPLPAFRALQDCWLLLIHPGFGVATAWAYRELARFPAAFRGRPGRAAALVTQLAGTDAAAAVAEFYNSLEAPVLEKHPVLRLFQEHCRAQGALGALMSGSGSTTFAVTRSPDTARAMAESLQARFGRCWTAVVPL